MGDETKWIALSEAVSKYRLDTEKLKLLIKEGEVRCKIVGNQEKQRYFIEDKSLLLRISTDRPGQVKDTLLRVIEGVAIGIGSASGTAMLLGENLPDSSVEDPLLFQEDDEPQDAYTSGAVSLASLLSKRTDSAALSRHKRDSHFISLWDLIYRRSYERFGTFWDFRSVDNLLAVIDEFATPDSNGDGRSVFIFMSELQELMDFGLLAQEYRRHTAERHRTEWSFKLFDLESALFDRSSFNRSLPGISVVQVPELIHLARPAKGLLRGANPTPMTDQEYITYLFAYNAVVPLEDLPAFINITREEAFKMMRTLEA